MARSLVDLDDADGVGAQARRSGRPSPSTSGSRPRRRRWRAPGRRRGAAVAALLDRCSAASRATRLAPELESWTTPPPVPVERNDAGQAEQVGEPVHDVLLELGGRRAGHPGHALDAEPGGDQVAEHRGAGGVGREVAEEAGVLPVRRPRAARPGRGRRGRPRTARPAPGAAAGRAARTSPGETCERTGKRPDPRPVVGDPVDDLVAVLPELLGSHVRCRLGHRRHRIGAHERAPGGVPRGRAGRKTTTLGRASSPREASARTGPEAPRASRARRAHTQQGNGTWPRCGPEDRNVMAAMRSGGSQSAQCPRCDSNAHCAGFESAPSADWGTGACRLPGARAA